MDRDVGTMDSFDCHRAFQNRQQPLDREGERS